MVVHFTILLHDVQPTQLYINERKLVVLEARYPPGTEATMEPVPVTLLRGQLSFTDGHTRAFLAWRRGLESVTAHWDDSELELKTYFQCVEWCHEAGIRTIADLASHVIDDAAYKVKWIARCEAIGRGEKDG